MKKPYPTKYKGKGAGKRIHLYPKPTPPTPRRVEESRTLWYGSTLADLVQWVEERGFTYEQVAITASQGYDDTVEIEATGRRDENPAELDVRYEQYLLNLSAWEAWHREHKDEIEIHEAELAQAQENRQQQELEKREKTLTKELAAVRKKIGK